MKNKAARRGFTIIEVIVVLAIAGLIFLIVFLVLPTLQKLQRDSQRKQDLGEVVGAIQTWQANHLGGNLDTIPELNNLKATYIKDKNDPSTGPYTIQIKGIGEDHISTPPAIGTIVYQVGHICGSDTDTSTYTTDSPIFTATVRQFVVLLTLEVGGVYCLDVE